jgi:hypothetical protein
MIVRLMGTHKTIAPMNKGVITRKLTYRVGMPKWFSPVSGSRIECLFGFVKDTFTRWNEKGKHSTRALREG